MCINTIALLILLTRFLVLLHPLTSLLDLCSQPIVRNNNKSHVTSTRLQILGCGKSYGHQIQTTTVGIKPGHLSKIWYEPFGPITEYFDVHSSAMNFEELATCKNFGDPHLSVGSNCRPFINIPPEVNSLRNEWATCSPFYHGVIDPPM